MTVFKTQTRRSVDGSCSACRSPTDRSTREIDLFHMYQSFSTPLTVIFFQLARKCGSQTKRDMNQALHYLHWSKKEHFCMHNPQREEWIKMTPEKKTRHVRFSSLEIVELPYTVGDNPCVSNGCPVAASWLSQKKTQFDIDFFERHRPARRSRKALLLSAVDRNAL